MLRSLTRCRASDMDRLFWFSLLLTYLPVTESMRDESCLSQPNRVIWKKPGHVAVFKCSVRSHCSDKGLHYEWFAFKENTHLRLNLGSNPLKYSLDGASLNIRSLNVNDSGIYHCAATSRGDPVAGAQHVGSGTTLVVMGKGNTMMRPILWLSFILLTIYSLAVVALIIKKYGSNMSGCKWTHKTGKKNSIKKTHFRDVLQEMYSKRNLGSGKKPASRSRPQAEAAGRSTDDIYQNV